MHVNKRYAVTGKTIRINLTSGEMRIEDTYHYLREWLSGYGLAGKILFEELPGWVTPYDPVNRVIISTGLLMGTLAPGASKIGFSTIGPVTGGWASGVSDSHLAIEMKQAGFDNIVLEGRSKTPCYLYITDDKVDLRDARSMWGMTTWETLEAVRHDIGDPQANVLSVGPAGENLVRGACVIQDQGRAVGRGGIGAVLGSKNVKAITAKGSKPIEIADVERFMAAIHDIDERIQKSPYKTLNESYGPPGSFIHKQKIGIPFKNFQHCQLDDDMVDSVNPIPLIDKYATNTLGYPGCRMRCGRMMHITEGPYNGTKACMNELEVIGTFMGRLAVRTGAFQVAVNAKCNQLGIDVDAAAGPIGWAMECFERGILTKEDTDGIELNWGDEKLILDLIDKTCKREGFGNILAEGSARAAEIVGRNSEYYAMHIKKMDLYELFRSSNAWGLGAAVATRGGGHVTSSPAYEQLANPPGDEACRREFGLSSQETWDPHDYETRHILVTYTEIITRICNSTGVCINHSTWGDPNLMNLDDFAELISAATGVEFSAKDLKTIGERQLNMEKAINTKFTDYCRKDDFPPEREMAEPVSRGYYKGWKIDRRRWSEMLDKYYSVRKWDLDTSYPTREALAELGLKHVADELEKMGRLGQSTRLPERILSERLS